MYMYMYAHSVRLSSISVVFTVLLGTGGFLLSVLVIIVTCLLGEASTAALVGVVGCVVTGLVLNTGGGSVIRNAIT